MSSLRSTATSRRRLACFAALAALTGAAHAQAPAAAETGTVNFSQAAVVAATRSISAAYDAGLGVSSSSADEQQQNQNSAAPGTAPIKKKQQATGVAAPGTAPMTSADRAKALAPGSGPTYDERWQLFGGLMFMNGQAGQNLPKRFNMGGAEVQGTYWLGQRRGIIGNHLGVTGDYRFGAGTTPVISHYYNRILIMEQTYTGGVTWRGPKNRYAAMQYHALAGGASGHFDYAVNHYPGGSPVAGCAAQQTPTQQGNLGLYCDKGSFFGIFGGSVDFNYSPRVAIRLQPDLVMEHFGTELREFVSVSGGLVYRFGHR